MNDFRTSTTALEIDAPQLSATQLVARPGALPTLTFPVYGDAEPDVTALWVYLSEPAEFFDVPMPSHDELAAATVGFTATLAAPTAVTVTIADRAGAPQILVSGVAISPQRRDAVRIAADDSLAPMDRPTDPRWRRMAARTTSKGDVDQLERWLHGRGHTDVVVADVPMLGALVYQCGADVAGVEHPEPTSILDQLERCGATGTIGRADARPAAVERAWWISPRYETHPVAAVGGTPYPVDPDVRPPFTRWS